MHCRFVAEKSEDVDTQQQPQHLRRESRLLKVWNRRERETDSAGEKKNYQADETEADRDPEDTSVGVCRHLSLEKRLAPTYDMTIALVDSDAVAPKVWISTGRVELGAVKLIVGIRPCGPSHIQHKHCLRLDKSSESLDMVYATKTIGLAAINVFPGWF